MIILASHLKFLLSFCVTLCYDKYRHLRTMQLLFQWNKTLSVLLKKIFLIRKLLNATWSYDTLNKFTKNACITYIFMIILLIFFMYIKNIHNCYFIHILQVISIQRSRQECFYTLLQLILRLTTLINIIKTKELQSNVQEIIQLNH